MNQMYRTTSLFNLLGIIRICFLTVIFVIIILTSLGVSIEPLYLLFCRIFHWDIRKSPLTHVLKLIAVLTILSILIIALTSKSFIYFVLQNYLYLFKKVGC